MLSYRRSKLAVLFCYAGRDLTASGLTGGVEDALADEKDGDPTDTAILKE
jgi:hypothetical protein